MIDYQKQNVFFGNGQYHVHGKILQVQISGVYKSHSSEPIKITVWSDQEGADAILDSSMRYPYSIWFEGTTDLEQPIWIMDITPHLITGMKRLQGEAGIYISGDHNGVVGADQKVFIHAKLSPTPIIKPEWMYSQSYDGTITKISDDEKKREGIKWKNELSEFCFIDNYEYVDAGEREQHLTLRIQDNSLFITHTLAVDSDLKSILNKLPQALDEALSLLSFLGRQRVVCYEATANFEKDEADFNAFCRYKTWEGFYNLPSDKSILRCLITPKVLREGLFDSLLKSFDASPYKAVIARTIPYLITSYEDGYVETHLVQAYAALESMVDGVGEALQKSYVMSNHAFKKLAEKIKEVVKEEINDPNVAEGVIKKLPELRRISFLDRLLFLLEEQKVNTDLIWPPDTDKPREFHELLKRRNLLIHTGSVDQGNYSLFDLNRVQKLVELWILKLLDCPEDAILKYSLWRGAPIDKILHY